jgi:transglutaminase-like putative cysteine protease
VRFLRPLPRAVTRPISLLVLVIWAATIGVLVKRTYLEASSVNLATDLARYGTGAQWRGIYYKGEKIGFSVNQVDAGDDGFELREDGRLQMTLFGAVAPVRIRTTARVDRAFVLQSFDFLLDPGTGPTTVSGVVAGRRLTLSVTTSGGTRTDVRELSEPPVLSVSLGRRLAGAGLVAGARHQWALFDPATLRNAPVTLDVGAREVVSVSGVGMPAFRVDMEFAGLHTRAWVTDTGEVVREESPMGLMTVRENAQRAPVMSVGWGVQTDLLEASAVVPVMKQRIAEPRDVRRLRVRLEGANLAGRDLQKDLQGVGQTVEGDIVELRDPQSLRAGPADPDARHYLSPEPFIESDDPAVVAEAEAAVRGIAGARARAERLTRHVNAMLEKKPTVSLPSAREVLRTKIGDCNEHTALYVALARATGIPARVAVGLTFVRGAFYYHAWPEVYLDEGGGRGYWLPVDPTLNQFPADATHLRLARGGLDRQAAILPLIGRMKMEVLELELAPGSVPILAGRRPTDMTPLAIPLPQRSAGGCWSSPPPAAPSRRR